LLDNLAKIMNSGIEGKPLKMAKRIYNKIFSKHIEVKDSIAAAAKNSETQVKPARARSEASVDDTKIEKLEPEKPIELNLPKRTVILKKRRATITDIPEKTIKADGDSVLDDTDEDSSDSDEAALKLALGNGKSASIQDSHKKRSRILGKVADNKHGGP
jgi:hypothetical protein